MISLDVSSINTVQTLLITQISDGFALFVIYAKRLLYYFIAFEIVLSGLAWALYQNNYAERLFFQILKIGLVLFIVENYTYLINALLNSMTMIDHQLNHTHVDDALLNPATIWQYGYNFALGLLQTAATSGGFALPLIFTILGFGILFVIGIFGIQIFLQVAGFYLVALVSLLSIPLSVFSPLKDFFSKSIKNILQASIRLMVQILLVSTAITVWSQMKLQNFNTDMNINVPLGFFFTGLLFVLASAYLPRLAAKVIGNIETNTATNSGQIASSSTSQPNYTSSQSYNHAVSATVSLNQPALLTHQTAAVLLQNNTSLASQHAVSEKEAVKTQFYTSEFNMQQHKSQELLQQQEIKKIKKAFYEVLVELQDKSKLTSLKEDER